MLPNDAFLQLTPDLRICRVLNGMWQVSGAHGRIDPDRAIATMVRHQDTGFTTWDLADHYGPAEEFIGRFRRQLSAARGADAHADLVAFTKWVPRPEPMTRPIVKEAIQRSLRRMQISTLDLLQFHWWVYQDPNYLTALQYLAELQEEGLIRYLGLTNFDTAHVGQILDAGIPIISNQVQYSLLDRRPEVNMAPLCNQRGVRLLAYGTLCGGLISDAYLGRPEPGYQELSTASLRKYKEMVDAWGGWTLFQELLQVVKSVADKHQVSMANVAVRYILDQPAVAGAILGVRLGESDHLEENLSLFGWLLDAEDIDRLEAASASGRDLYSIIGDCGNEYR